MTSPAIDGRGAMYVSGATGRGPLLFGRIGPTKFERDKVQASEDDFGMRKLPLTAAEDLLEIVMRRYERASTLLTSNRPVEDWGKLLGDTASVGSMLDRLLHHGHVLKCGPRSWRTKTAPPTGESSC